MTYETFDIVYVSNEVPVSVYCMNSDMIVPTMPTLYSVTIIITETPHDPVYSYIQSLRQGMLSPQPQAEHYRVLVGVSALYSDNLINYRH